MLINLAGQAPLLILLSCEVPVVQLQRRPYEQVTVQVRRIEGQQQINETVSKEQAELTTTSSSDDPGSTGPHR